MLAVVNKGESGIRGLLPRDPNPGRPSGIPNCLHPPRPKFVFIVGEPGQAWLCLRMAPGPGSKGHFWPRNRIKPLFRSLVPKENSVDAHCDWP